MAVTNLVKDQPDDHAKRIALFAIEAIQAANRTLIDRDDESRGCVAIRVGFHSGSVVADVVGTRNPRYCLFGDTGTELFALVDVLASFSHFILIAHSFGLFSQHFFEDGEQL